MKKGAKLGLLGLAAGLGTAGSIAAIGNALYNQVMVPVVRTPLSEERELPLQREGRHWARRAEGFQEASIRSVDGLSLWAAVVPAREENSHRWAVCLHGIKDEHSAIGFWGRRFHEDGWNVLMPDQRGYGRSEGSCIGWGFDERLDLVAWISWIVRRDPQAEILLMGVSMGAATVLMATGGALPKQVRAAIADCSYTTIESEMLYVVDDFRRKNARIPPLPTALLFSILRQTVLRRAGFDLKNAAPVEAVERSEIPTLFIHGVKDTVVPPHMMEKLYRAARCPKSFLWVPEAGHADSLAVAPELCWSTVTTFVESWFQ